MPYLYDYSVTYKAQIKAYYEAQIDSSYGGSASMKTQLNSFLDAITTAETSYKSRMNALNILNSLRFRWRLWFGILNLYVFYKHCVEFPVGENLPPVIDGMIPWPSGALGGANDDLRSFAVPWRYSWTGDGMTSNPWFVLSPGTVAEAASQEVSKMQVALNNNYPYYADHYTNQDSYAIGEDNGAGTLSTIQDSSPACGDYDRFSNYVTASFNANYGVVDRMKDFMGFGGYTYMNYRRFQEGQTIMNYMAAGHPITIVDEPKDWMLNHGGQQLMDYFGWTDINGNIL